MNRAVHALAPILAGLAVICVAATTFAQDASVDAAADAGAWLDASVLCGNGVVDDGEMCDGSDLDGETCESITMGSAPIGFLGCSGSCTFIAVRCASPTTGPPTGGTVGLLPPPRPTGTAFGGFGGGFGGFGGGFGGFGGGFGGRTATGSGGGDPAAPAECVPGIQEDCPCRDGSDGYQICFDDGSGFDACQCPASSDLGDDEAAAADAGGCSCRLAAPSRDAGATGLGLAGLAIVLLRRRRPRVAP